MNPRDLQDYASRDWGAAEASETAHWAELKRTLGAAEGLRVGETLRLHVRMLRPDWPDVAEREADLAHHVRLAEALRRVVLPRAE